MRYDFLFSFFPRRYVFHLLYILAYIGFLVLDKQWYSRNNDWASYLPTFCIHLSLMMLLVYLNTFVLIPYLEKTKKLLVYIVCLLLLIGAYTFLKVSYDRYNMSRLFNLKDSPVAPYIWNSVVYAIWFTVISSMLYITQNWYDHRQLMKNIQISQLQTELKYLRSQINPHFLFNGLNTIYGFIDIGNQQAREVLLQFSSLLRYNLYEADVDMIDLGKEVSYIQNYVALQKARSNPALSISLQTDIENDDLKIAPLLLIPFIENAFKFSSHEEDKGGSIVISLVQTGNRIHFECRNSYEAGVRHSGGIGLNNVKRRLDLLYKDSYTLEIEDENDHWNIKLILIL